MKITKIGAAGLKLIQDSEGFSSKPYLCPANVCTIGFGNTFYEDGTKVKLTDTPITKERGLELLKMSLHSFERHVDSLTRDDINQNQFDALCSFCYNLGPTNLKSSTLLRLINENPDNVVPITQNFLKWNRAGGKVMKGLTIRRQKEAELFYKEI